MFLKGPNGIFRTDAPEGDWPGCTPATSEEIAVFQAGPTPDDREAEALSALNGGGGAVDVLKLFKAKVISDEAYRLGKSPAQLTGQELAALRSRIATIYKNL